MKPENPDGLLDRKRPEFSAMLCLYKNNVAAEVREALNSTFKQQTLPPTELIAVFDGPVPSDVAKVIDEFEAQVPIKRIVFPQNRGHGPARAAALDACDKPWIAIVDADDISLPDRFEKLMAIAEAHPDCAVIGGGYTEFHVVDGQSILGSTAVLPETPAEVKRFLRSRAPVAQPTAILHTRAIREVGNYKPWFNNEDYYLWIRLVAAGFTIRNIPDPVLLLRTNPEFYGRRGGLKYWWNEVSLQGFSLRSGTTTLPLFLFGASIRFVVQVIMPNFVRAAFYKKVLRRE